MGFPVLEKVLEDIVTTADSKIQYLFSASNEVNAINYYISKDDNDNVKKDNSQFNFVNQLKEN